MALHYSCSTLVISILLLISIDYSNQLQSSQAQTLLRIQRLLNFPTVLSNWHDDYTDFCNIDPNSFLTVVCYEQTITQLHIIGERGVPPLPKNFSIDSFVTTLVKLSDLKVLTLSSLGLWGSLPDKISRLSLLEILNISCNYLSGEIPKEFSSLSNLQTLILDDNMFSGSLMDWIGFLPTLTVLSVKRNAMNGTLPDSLGNLENLRVLALSHNKFYGEVPDLSSLTNLQVLDLEDNALGPQFPQLGNKLTLLVLKKNMFSSGIPVEISSYYQLQNLDISFNRFVGPFPLALLSLPSISYLNIAENKFTGMLFDNLSCNAELEFVDLSANLLTGKLPNCLLSNSKNRVVLYSRNCLETGNQNQHPFSFCRNEALAVGILPRRKKRKHGSKAVIAVCIIGGIMGGIALLGLIFFIIRRVNAKRRIKMPQTRFIAENASNGYTSKLLSDARYVSQAMKLGGLGLPAYRSFSLEELEEATNNFDTSTFMGEGSHGQMYRGQLKDGSLVAIRCLKMKKSHGTQNFTHHVELISKLRHRHLVSALGHCFECYLDDSSVSRIFLVFEYITNGTLRNGISADINTRQKLTWEQRISAAIGVAKGLQFLHTGIVPGVFCNNLKITDVLLDQNLVAKISSYNLPLLAENMRKIGRGGGGVSSKEENKDARVKYEDKSDVYDLGVILLEMIVGREMNSRNETDDIAVDSEIEKECSDESVKTMMEICKRCLLKSPVDRPSIEDVLWNLQFAAQVQEAWRGGGSHSHGSSTSNDHSQSP